MQDAVVSPETFEIEQAVLGSILYEPELMDECTLIPEQFSIAANQTLFTAFKELQAKGNPIDTVLVVHQLGHRIQQVGGTDYINKLAQSIPSTANFEYYESLIQGKYQIRAARQEMAAFVADPSSEKLADTCRKIETLLDEPSSSSEESDADVLADIVDSLSEEKGDISGVTTGSTELDEMTSGLQDGELIIVAGRPSMGKSAFALNIGIAAASKGTVVDFFSLEMPKRMTLNRILSTIGNVDLKKWKNPKRMMSSDDIERVMNAVGMYSDYPMTVHDVPSLTVANVRSTLRHSIKDYPNSKHLVIIDYLSFMKVVGRYERRDLEIGALTKGLKQLARTFKIPIILLSQLSRGVEQRQDKRPMMSDLRESGNIEQDADLILLLYRDDYYNKESDKQNIAEIIVAKQRNGPVGTVEMAFIKEYGKFANIDRRHLNE